MAEVESPRALLVMAVQDLYDGEVAMVERLGTVRGNLTDAELRGVVEEDQGRSKERREALARIARGLDAAPEEAGNIWLRAILDDADNDARTIARGRLLDIALAGALRKGKQAQRVSYETALALARRLAMEDAAAALGAMVEAAEATDTALASALWRLSGEA